MWFRINDNNDLCEGDIIELGTEYPLMLHYAVVVIIDGEKKCAHYPYPQSPCIEDLDYVINNRPDKEIKRVMRTGKTSEEIINNHQIVKEQSKQNFSNWIFCHNCEDYIRKVTGIDIGTDQRVYLALFIIMVILIIVALK